MNKDKLFLALSAILIYINIVITVIFYFMTRHYAKVFDDLLNGEPLPLSSNFIFSCFWWPLLTSLLLAISFFKKTSPAYVKSVFIFCILIEPPLIAFSVFGFIEPILNIFEKLG